jgi:hypothetical protein
MATQPPFLSKIAMNDHFQWHWRLTPTNFWPWNGLHHKSKNVIYGKETYARWGVRASSRWSMATQPPFLSKIAMNHHIQWHWRLTPMDFWARNGLRHRSKNVIGFLPKKWSPPKIQQRDLWQGKICGVRCTSLRSMINGHTNPIFVENSHGRPFSIIPKASTYEFLTKKWSPP